MPDTITQNSDKRVVYPYVKQLRNITQNKKLKGTKVLFGSKYYNCWSFTAFAFNWRKELEWMSEYNMENCLRKFSEPVEVPQNGDIVVFRVRTGLAHTAILIDVDKRAVLHKPGGRALELNTIEGAKEIYDNTDSITFRRAKKVA